MAALTAALLSTARRVPFHLLNLVTAMPKKGELATIHHRPQKHSPQVLLHQGRISHQMAMKI
jgi:hypothetical protein